MLPIAACLLQCNQCKKFKVLKQNSSYSPNGMLHSVLKSYAVPRYRIPARLSLPEYHVVLLRGKNRTKRRPSLPVFARTRLVSRADMTTSSARCMSSTRARPPLGASIGMATTLLRTHTHILPSVAMVGKLQ